ncbi:MAG: hypothetical protein ACOZNI_23275 [Myxococcota bacterium]
MGGVALLSLLACEGLADPRAAVVPRELALVVYLGSGRYASVLADLSRNPRREVDLRLGEGLVVYDGRRVWELAEEAGTVVVTELVSGNVTTLPVTGVVLRVADGRVWVDTGTDVVACELRAHTCASADLPGTLRDTYDGPGEGFRVVQRDGRLVLLLPSEADDAEGTAITGRYDNVVAMHWITEPDDLVRPVLDRHFRGRASLVLAEVTPAVDGDLAEWSPADAVVVEAPWQIEEGGEAWGGPRDGSFSVAAARTDTAVCLAGRVRDDDVRAGDRLRLAVGPLTEEVPLVGPIPARAARAEDWFGVAYEVCIDLPPRLLAQVTLRFTVAFDDLDEDGATVLSAAPPVAGVPGGMLRAGR